MRLLSNSIKGRGVVFLVVIICLFGGVAFGQYCSASGGGQQYISAVIVGTLANTGTGSDGYVDYTSMSTTISLGESQIATIINGLSITGSQCGIWVDWNADSDFDDAEETIAMSGGPALFTGTITAPGETTAGDKRMRVRIMGTGSITPCGNTTYGEVEDYTIAVVVPWSGIGDANDPYQIWTAEDMDAIGASSAYWGAHFKLMADIDLSAYTGTSFNIIGIYVYRAPDNKPFTGVFDGNGHTISNFTYSPTGKDGIGLFRYVDGPSAEIKDLGLINPDVTGHYYVGSLVGEMGDEGSISNCYLEGGSVSGNYGVGGLVGRNDGTIRNSSSNGSISGNGAYYTVGGLVGRNGGTITDCHSSGSVSGTGPYGGYAGGLVGTGGIITNCSSSASVSVSGDICPAGGLVGSGGNISNCYATGSVSGTGDYSELIGGLAGGGGTITNCYATGSVSGPTRVGGLVGSGGTISNCYSTGSVSGTGGAVGGLVGTGATVSGSFWDIETSGLSTSAGGEGKTTAQMKDSNTYLYWGCEAAWTIDDGVDYPRLLWENAPGELLDAELSDFVDGAGTESEPYLIYTAEELNLVGLFWCEFDKHFKLMADIDLSGITGTSFNRIGVRLPFNGVFDGNGHTISNFTSTRGLFETVAGQNAEIRDLGLIDPNVNKGGAFLGGLTYVGSLAAVLKDATISGCYVEGGSISGNSKIGGLVADSNGIITNCYSSANVVGNNIVIGGLVAHNKGTITNCYSTGSVSGYNPVGGLVGSNGGGGTITYCYSTGSVSGNYYVGGLVGNHYGTGTIYNCYSTSSVSGDGNIGGLVGGNGGEIRNCYSFGNVEGSTKVGGFVGLTSAGGTITNCYSLGTATGSAGIGGLVGDNSGAITNCYSTGGASGTTDYGGLVGVNRASVANSFWDTQTSGLINMCGSSQFGATGCDDDNGKTTAEMQMASTFTSAGWDFVDEVNNGYQDIWRLCNEGIEYAQLNWQYLLGDFACPDGVNGIDLGVLCDEWLLEELSWDVWPEGGDGFVNFLDWAIFADGWQTTHDIFDLAEFADQWLKTGANYLIADIAPTRDGDGIVNMLDFAALANNWLQ